MYIYVYIEMLYFTIIPSSPFIFQCNSIAEDLGRFTALQYSVTDSSSLVVLCHFMNFYQTSASIISGGFFIIFG